MTALQIPKCLIFKYKNVDICWFSSSGSKISLGSRTQSFKAKTGFMGAWPRGKKISHTDLLVGTHNLILFAGLRFLTHKPLFWTLKFSLTELWRTFICAFISRPQQKNSSKERHYSCIFSHHKALRKQLMMDLVSFFVFICKGPK